VLAAGEQRAGEAAADLEAFDGGDRQHRAASGQRTGVASIASRVTPSPSGSTPAVMPFTSSTHAITSMPSGASTARATAPAATRLTVSRALARPPPAIARIPNFASYV
jgi:hypothetical protein